MQTGAKAYLAIQVETTSQGEILLLLYEAAIKFLNQSKEKIAERDYAQKGILISKALDVIAELDSSLNSSKGGNIAETLHQLYFYCNTRLLQANLKMDVEIIDEVIRVLDGVASAYREIIKSGAGSDMSALAKAAAAQTAGQNAPNQAAPPQAQKKNTGYGSYGAAEPGEKRILKRA